MGAPTESSAMATLETPSSLSNGYQGHGPLHALGNGPEISLLTTATSEKRSRSGVRKSRSNNKVKRRRKSDKDTMPLSANSHTFLQYSLPGANMDAAANLHHTGGAATTHNFASDLGGEQPQWPEQRWMPSSGVEDRLKQTDSTTHAGKSAGHSGIQRGGRYNTDNGMDAKACHHMDCVSQRFGAQMEAPDKLWDTMEAQPSSARVQSIAKVHVASHVSDSQMPAKQLSDGSIDTANTQRRSINSQHAQPIGTALSGCNSEQRGSNADTRTGRQWTAGGTLSHGRLLA